VVNWHSVIGVCLLVFLAYRKNSHNRALREYLEVAFSGKVRDLFVYFCLFLSIFVLGSGCVIGVGKASVDLDLNRL